MTKRTALFEIEKSLGARFEIRTVPAPSASTTEWEVAASYSTLDEEYAAVRQAAGLIDLSHRGKIEINGPDRVRFINSQVTNDVKSLPAGQGCYACALDYKGALVADLKIYVKPSSLLIDASENCAAKLFDHLNRFAISDEVEILDQTEELAHLTIHGPRSRAILMEACGQDVAALSEFSHQEIHLASQPVLVTSQSYLGEIGFDLILPASDASVVWKTIVEKGRTFGLNCVGVRTLNILRLEVGVPEFGIDMTEDHLALEANLRSAISTTKGCYTGQEVVARIINRGHVNRILSGLVLSESAPLTPGLKIFQADKVAGEVTSAAFSPGLHKNIALGYIPASHSQPGTRFSLAQPNGPYFVEVAVLPFYKHS